MSYRKVCSKIILFTYIFEIFGNGEIISGSASAECAAPNTYDLRLSRSSNINESVIKKYKICRLTNSSRMSYEDFPEYNSINVKHRYHTLSNITNENFL